MENIVCYQEAESIVDNLKAFEIKHIGSIEWLKQHENIEKLNMEAIMNAQTQSNEIIRDIFLSNNQIVLLVADLISVHVWKEKISHKIIEIENISINFYMANYHEATLINLFETLMFHGDIIQQMDKVLLDLVDYCYQKLNYWSTSSEKDIEAIFLFYKEGRNKGDKYFYTKRIDYEIMLKCITIIRYIVDNLKILNTSVAHRIFNVHDIPMLYIYLIENPPWKCIHDDKVWKFMENKWTNMQKVDDMKLTKIEGQLWICLYQMLIVDSNKYALNNYRKNIILRLRGYLNQSMIAQIPALETLEEYLDRLTISNPPLGKTGFFIEQIPELKTKFIDSIKIDIDAIAKYQIENYFNSEKDDASTIQSLAKTYDIEKLQSLIPQDRKCSHCGAEDVVKKCSSCKSEYYCNRKCQISDWERHKNVCTTISQKI